MSVHMKTFGPTNPQLVAELGAAVDAMMARTTKRVQTAVVITVNLSELAGIAQGALVHAAEHCAQGESDALLRIPVVEQLVERNTHMLLGGFDFSQEECDSFYQEVQLLMAIKIKGVIAEATASGKIVPDTSQQVH